MNVCSEAISEHRMCLYRSRPADRPTEVTRAALLPRWQLRAASGLATQTRGGDKWAALEWKRSRDANWIKP